MLVPRHFEQFANADSLGALGVAVGLRGGGNFTVDDVGRAVACVVDDAGYRERAASRARELADRPLRALDRVTAECIAWASRERGAS